jgi:hypothetical protein
MKRDCPCGTGCLKAALRRPPDDIWVHMNRWNYTDKAKTKDAVLIPLRPPQIQHRLAWMRTQAFGVSSWRLTSWAKVRANRLHAAVRKYPMQLEVSYLASKMSTLLSYPEIKYELTAEILIKRFKATSASKLVPFAQTPSLIQNGAS